MHGKPGWRGITTTDELGLPRSSPARVLGHRGQLTLMDEALPVLDRADGAGNVTGDYS